MAKNQFGFWALFEVFYAVFEKDDFFQLDFKSLGQEMWNEVLKTIIQKQRQNDDYLNFDTATCNSPQKAVTAGYN